MGHYYVDDVLSNVFNNDEPNWKLTDKIQAVVKALEYCKDDLKTFLVGSNYDIDIVLRESDYLCSESDLLVEDLKKCKKEVEIETMADIAKSIENYKKLSKELKSVKFAESLVGNFIKCGKLMIEFHEAVEGENYSQAVESLCGVLEIMDNPPDCFDTLDIAGNTREVAQVALDNIIMNLHTYFDQLLSISVKENAKKKVITITLNIRDNNRCFDIVNALFVCDKISEKVHKFAEILLNEVLIPIVHYESSVTYENDETLTITVYRKNPQRTLYTEVIANHKQIFDILSKRLHFTLDANKCMFQMMGEHLCERYSNMIMHECFVYTIPKNISDLNNYDSIATDITNFQYYLEAKEFFPPESDVSILSYIKDIEKHFAQSAARHLLDTARSIMLKDLSTSMSIGVTGIENFPDASTSNSNPEALSRLEKNIPKCLYYFPRCMISKSAQELLDHLYTIMEQASQCEEVVCKKMYCVARMIFELYEAVVPYHHEKYLQTIPQYVALFHNNCMYLAHNLLTFGDKWVLALEGREVDYPISFIDLVQRLRDLGHRHLTMHMQQQRKQILDNIRSSDLNSIVTKDVLSDNAEAAVRQCLRQLHLLKNVWIGVFPANVFTRLMATLVNMFADELIHRVCTVEDISAEMATQLSDMYSLVVQKSPLLFANPNDVETQVKSWIKLQELIFVLRGTLKDIDGHWADGSGPLARHFRTEELRSLIKALFQNTQIRANILSKIK